MKRVSVMAIIFAAAATIYAADPFVGTWKLNATKSKDANLPKELIAIATEKGDQIELTVKGTEASGTAISERSTVAVKGGVVKYLEGGPPAGMTATLKVVDAMTREQTMTLDGKVVGTSRLVLSKDGKTITQTGDFVDPQGKPAKFVRVYEKQ